MSFDDIWKSTFENVIDVMLLKLNDETETQQLKDILLEILAQMV